MRREKLNLKCQISIFYMNYFYSIIAGVIQGLTEFLPVSSSGHLILFHDFLNFNFPDSLAFDVILHLGTLLALVIFFLPDVVKYLRAFFKSFSNWKLTDNKDQLLAWYIFIATLPAAIVGYFLEDLIEVFFRNSAVVAGMLIVFGILLYLADKFYSQTKLIEDLNLSNALTIGVSQVLALIPGVSRSAITIIAGLSQNLKRDQAARFSFLLAIPIVFGAGVKKVLDLFSTNILNSSDFAVLAIGFLISAAVGYLCIKYFLKFLENYSLKIFAYYRVILGLIILGILFFN